LFDIIEDALIKILQEKLTNVPKDNITTRKIDLEKATFPFLSLYDADFTLEDLGIGRESGESKEEISEKFSGDGKKSSFQLSVRPIKPIISIESPLGQIRKENEDYTVDYEKGVVAFFSPPEKGKENILIRYFSAKGVFVTRGLKVNAKYYIDVWASDKDTCDSMAIDVIKALLIGRDELAKKGLNIKPIQGYNIEPEKEFLNLAFGKRLEYSIETDILVRIPTPLIEKIKIQKKSLVS
jgi:hypothetical protein